MSVVVAAGGVLIVVVVIAEMIAKSSWGKLENTVFIRIIDFCILHTPNPDCS